MRLHYAILPKHLVFAILVLPPLHEKGASCKPQHINIYRVLSLHVTHILFNENQHFYIACGAYLTAAVDAGALAQRDEAGDDGAVLIQVIDEDGRCAGVRKDVAQPLLDVAAGEAPVALRRALTNTAHASHQAIVAKSASHAELVLPRYLPVR